MKVLRNSMTVLSVLSLFVLFNACENDEDNEETLSDNFTLTSLNFADNGTIPLIHACTALGGDNQSPELSWINPPQNTNSYALIVDDEDSPCGSNDNACKHWSVYNIPASTTGFGADESVTNIAGITEGQNYTGSVGFEGPCPPSQHTYNFTIYALESGMSAISSGTALTRSQFQSSYGQYILDSATLHGNFSP